MVRWLLVLMLFAWPLAAGCQRGDASYFNDEQFAEWRARYLLGEEPAGAQGVLDVGETLKSPSEVVLVGQIGGVQAQSPWSEGQASFMIVDPSVMAEIEGHDHAHCQDSGCAFCAKTEDNIQSLALVQFLDDSGQVLRVDARRLFDLKEKQTVVVRGRASVHKLGFLVVAADGLYVRR